MKHTYCLLQLLMVKHAQCHFNITVARPRLVLIMTNRPTTATLEIGAVVWRYAPNLKHLYT